MKVIKQFEKKTQTWVSSFIKDKKNEALNL